MTGPQTVMRRRGAPGGHDANGDPVTSTTTDLAIPGCLVAPRDESGEGRARGRHGVIVGLTAYLPAGVDLVHTDQLVVGGVPYAIEGEPGVWTSPWPGGPEGVEVALRRAAG